MEPLVRSLSALFIWTASVWRKKFWTSGLLSRFRTCKPLWWELYLLLEIFLSQGYKKRKRRMRIETKEDLNYSVGLCPFSARDIFLQKEENFDLTKQHIEPILMSFCLSFLYLSECPCSLWIPGSLVLQLQYYFSKGKILNNPLYFGKFCKTLSVIDNRLFTTILCSLKSFVRHYQLWIWDLYKL